MTMPSASEYNEALQLPRYAFRDQELQSCKVEQTPFGLPRPRSGGFAITYHLLNHRDWAVRCFYRPVRDLEQRYAAISRYLLQHPSDRFVRFEYQPQGINVRGSWHPIVKMEWVHGKTLGLFVEDNYRDRARIAQIRSDFVDLVRHLEQLGVAHGDLQHGNIIVRSNGHLILVDYDGMYVPGMQISDSSEVGHPNYQHPARTNRHFGPWLDRFSAAVIYISLVFIERDPQIFDRYHNAENLIFTSNDYANPDDSNIFKELELRWGNDPLLTSFRALIGLPVDRAPTLNDFMSGQLLTSVTHGHVLPALTTISDVQKYHKQTSQLVVGNLAARRPYPLLSAADVAELLARDGQVVEVIGQVVDTFIGTTKFGAPYMFINFGDWRRGCFYVVIWQEVLGEFNERGVTPCDWKGKWISVTGLLTSYERLGKRSPQIQLERASQVRLLQGEDEAKQLLAGHIASGSVSATGANPVASPSGRNRDLLSQHWSGWQLSTPGPVGRLQGNQASASSNPRLSKVPTTAHRLAGLPTGGGAPVPRNRDLVSSWTAAGGSAAGVQRPQPATQGQGQGQGQGAAGVQRPQSATRRRGCLIATLAIVAVITALAVLAYRDQDVTTPDDIAIRVPTATPAATASPRTVIVTVPVPTAPPTVERYLVSQPPPATPRPRVAAVAGDWIVTNFIRTGPGAGTQATFRVRLTQAGATVTGTGDLTLFGQLEGTTLWASYTHLSGGGEVVWAFSADGTGFAGTFTNASLGNRGESLGQRWAEASPWQVVSLFYTLLSGQRYEEAYALLSPRFQAQLPWPRWRAGYTTTLAVVIEAVEAVSPSPPTVAVRVLAADLIDGQRLVRRFAGTWTLVRTAEGWKLDVGRIQVVP